MASSKSFSHGVETDSENETTTYEEAELEIAEVDGALLREILEDLDKDDDMLGSDSNRVVECMVQPLEANHDHRGSTVLNMEAQNLGQGGVPVQDLDYWLEVEDNISEMTLALAPPPPPPGDELMFWHPDDIVGPMEFDVGYHLELHGGVCSDETGYSFLWEDS